ncbi:MAG: pyridoxal phosphate-dependent aminotransferase [Bacteroidales bacterium]|jgi:aspartate/methionine/tyrosine aminotransferase|nr:pyridoxal phosphate-dependent aminotransferase [Bacteroidales bacterium]
MNTPIPHEIVKQKIKESGLPSVGKATIREIVKLVNEIEKATGQKYIRMEMGVPGLEPAKVGIDAEIEALRNGVAQFYPMIDGVPSLKKEISRFVKNFINIDIDEKCCIPTVGSMQGGMAAFLVANRCDAQKDTVLFIDPGFPVQKQQLKVLGMKFETFDVYNYRGDKLKEKLEHYLKKGNISTILYSNPNNPSWICFTEKELETIGNLANQYDTIVIEDLAYFAMDFRKDLSKPGVPPYQDTVANYTDNWLMLISSSKAFSYAGQRIGSMVISNKLFSRRYPDLKRFFSSDEFGYAMIYGAVYSLSSGTSHSAQYGLAAMLKAANDGDFNFVDAVKTYGKRAHIMKKLFTDNGFKIVYDMDEDKPLADGFYFTISYPGLTGEELIEELVYYGISAISLAITGSERTEGLRACVSQTHESQFADLEYRLKMFQENHPVKS